MTSSLYCIKDEILQSAFLSKLVYKINHKILTNLLFYDDLNEIIDCNSITFKLFNKYYSNIKFISFIENKNTGLASLLSIDDNKKFIHLTFAGTDVKTIDILYNLMYDKQYLDNDIFVHKGYYLHLTKDNYHTMIIDKLIETIQKYPDYKIIISGHSLGSGVSIILAYFLIKKLDPQILKKITLISHGYPNITNTKMFKLFKQFSIQTYFLYNKNDFVEYLFPGYIPPVCKFYLNDDSYLKISQKNNSIINIYKTKYFGNRYITNHLLDKYLCSYIRIFCPPSIKI